MGMKMLSTPAFWIGSFLKFPSNVSFHFLFLREKSQLTTIKSAT